MSSPIVDLRSDTVTRPTPGMLQAMVAAEVGDDVYGDDPTVRRLEAEVARLLGKEAALLVPSGTMGNQISIRSHTEPGDEIIAESEAHVFLYEGGAYAALSGVSMHCVDAERGLLTADEVERAVRPRGDSHFPLTRLVCLENSANRAGGTVYSPERLAGIEEVARRHGLKLHLDGARLFNAAVAQDVELRELAAPFDSVNVCLSKGLGCPAGSLVAGSRAFIARAHRFRKMFGGGMRQAGYLAAAGLHALEHHVERLGDDHARARRLAEGLDGLPGVRVDLDTVMTNMVYADVSASELDAEAWVDRLGAQGVRTSDFDPRTLRFVTHLDVDDDGVDRALAACGEIRA